MKRFKQFFSESTDKEVELEEKLAWSHKTYADYVAHNKAKGLQVIPKDLWHNLKKNPNQPSIKKEKTDLDEEHSTWMVHVHKPVNKLKQGKTVMVKARNSAEAIRKGAIKHGDESARHGDFLRAEKLKEETELDEAKKPKPGHNAAVMAKNISKVLAAIKK